MVKAARFFTLNFFQIKNAKHLVGAASLLWGFAAFFVLCYNKLIIFKFRTIGQENKLLKTSSLALRNSFSFSDNL